MERVFEELSFTAPDRTGPKDHRRRDFVEKNRGELSSIHDLFALLL